MYAGTAQEALAKRKAFVRKWRIKCRGVADSLEEAGDRLFTLPRLPDRPVEVVAHDQRDRAPARGVQAPDQCVWPSAETACLLLWALLASGQITLRRVDGWDSLHVEPAHEPQELAA